LKWFSLVSFLSILPFLPATFDHPSSSIAPLPPPIPVERFGDTHIVLRSCSCLFHVSPFSSICLLQPQPTVEGGGMGGGER
jgi:hypothetical protein